MSLKTQRSPNAQLAVDMYDQLLLKYGWNKSNAWRGIALLLLSCDIYPAKSIGWQPFHDVVVYRETNDFKMGRDKVPGNVLQRANQLTDFLAKELNIPRVDLCKEIALYWRHPKIAAYQPHNLVGHAFRSLLVNILSLFGDKNIQYEEEVFPAEEFPGHPFTSRSKKAKIDIVARRGQKTVALISARWRFRHDRVDVVDEALAYVPAARRQNPDCEFFAAIGEFAPNRLQKILANCPPEHPHSVISAAVHFAPDLIRLGLKENGRIEHLKSLEWLVDQTYSWS